MKDKPQSWRKYLQTTHSTKDWYLEYISNSQNAKGKKQTNQLEHGQKT